jgi:predicted nucleotide-binding protein (sugar kinase/HSP70/actin superfamily)
MWVAVKGMLEYMGLDVIVPPPPTRETLTLGVQHSPEFACLPLKISIGNFIEAQKLGADTFMMVGGSGPCRFGLYAQLEKEILQDLGFNYDSLIIEPPDTGYWQFIRRVKKAVGPISWWKIIQGIRLGYKKAIIVDHLEKLVQEIRPREEVKGTADKIFQNALPMIADTQNFHEIEEVFGLTREKLLHIPRDEHTDVLKIGLVGEIYTLLEPFASMEIEKRLGYMGVYVRRSLYLSEWINDHLLSPRIFKAKGNDYRVYARPFLNHFVGGHGMESIGAGVAFAKEGYDGIVQVAPLTCMPEIVAHNIFPQVSEKCGIPILNIYVDEQTGEAGLETRLEAFIELLEAKRHTLTEKKQYVTIL